MYFKFLDTEDAIDAYSESEIDLWLLSYVLNTTICALTYNLPKGQGHNGGRYEWRFFPGYGIVNETTKFSCKPQALYLLNEHLVHWTRLVATSRVVKNIFDTASEVVDEFSDESPVIGLEKDKEIAEQEIGPTKMKEKKQTSQVRTEQSLHLTKVKVKKQNRQKKKQQEMTEQREVKRSEAKRNETKRSQAKRSEDKKRNAKRRMRREEKQSEQNTRRRA